MSIQVERDATLWPGLTLAYRRHTRRFDSVSYTLTPRLAPVEASG